MTRRAAVVAAALGVLLLSAAAYPIGVARADGRKPSVMVFSPKATHGKAAKNDALVTREVRSAIERGELGELLPQQALDLEAMQLAIDCVGETAECLGDVAKRSKARVLVVPSVERSAGMTSLRILYFDAQGDREPRHAQRSAKGKELDGSVVEAIPEMLRELFKVEAETKSPADDQVPNPAPLPAEPESVDIDAMTAPEPTRKPFPIGPLLVAGGGALVLASGIAAGVMMKSTQDTYAKREVGTPIEAQRAEKELDRGQQQALVANVLLGVGAAALIAGGVWFAFSLGSERAPVAQARVSPSLSTESAGVVLAGSFEVRP